MNIKFYDTLGLVLRPAYKLLFPGSRVTGAENIPDEGGVVICSNHIHWNDCLYLAAKIRNRRITYMCKVEAMNNKFTNWLLGEKGLGAIPVHRGESDLTAVRTSLQTVKNGDVLGIFPQGTRSKDNTPTPMLNGVSMIAMRAGAPIIPIYIDGPYRLFRRVDVRIGKPIDISDLGRRADAATLTEATGRIEKAIWGMREEK